MGISFRAHPGFKALLPLLAFALAQITWLPTLLALGSPSADQVWESFGIGSSCIADHFQLGWLGVSSHGTGVGAFTASLPASALSWLACALAHLSGLNPLQAFLLLGLPLTFGLTLAACHYGGFEPTTSSLVAFLITTAPSSFSRVGHLSLALLWPVVPGLLACHALWQTMAPPQPQSKRSPTCGLVGSGALWGLLCLPGQDYYIAFLLLQLATCFGLLLLVATTRSTRWDELRGIAGRGVGFGFGFALVVLVAIAPKLIATGAAGPPAAWAAPRYAFEQFSYGLLPFTWVIPSPWIPLAKQALMEAGIPPSTESYFWSAGSLLIPLAWLVALWQLARPATASRDQRRIRFFALLLGLTTFLGLFVMTMGGMGTLFAAIVSPVLRSLNRYTVFVYGASLLLFASLFEATLRSRRP